jgi:SecD/SecF fusion protein
MLTGYTVVYKHQSGPTVAEDIKTNAYWAVLGAMLIVYLLISFRKWQYGLGAIAAVAHDVIFVLGFILYFIRLCLLDGN